uniref:Uncharacterized protein n=1 Tax=Acinetobacter pittii TaxID=48296 RepID=A0A6G6AQG3_ACIPI|nr:hypothetical protein [Acinetobacter pittii]
MSVPTKMTALTLTFLFGLLGSAIIERMFVGQIQLINFESVLKVFLYGGLFILTQVFSEAMREENWVKHIHNY